MIARLKREKGWLVWALHSGYDLDMQQHENLARLLDEICLEGIKILKPAVALERLK
ncbi:MAG: hypothetical protein R2880_19750 [Deinococcales bacterium]